MKKKKIILSIVICVLVVMLISSIGATAAIWSGEGGDTGYYPAVPSTDWNTWAKYFDTVDIEDGVAITSYTGTNLEDVIIPQSIDGKMVLSIRNTVFANTTLKSLPRTLKIPPTVTSIESNAFSALTNLNSVSFGDAEDVGMCDVGEYAFAGCSNLQTVTFADSMVITFAPTAFVGCIYVLP